MCRRILIIHANMRTGCAMMVILALVPIESLLNVIVAGIVRTSMLLICLRVPSLDAVRLHLPLDEKIR